MRSTYWRAEASDRSALMLDKASRTSSTVAARRPPLGSPARKRLAVTSKLRWGFQQRLVRLSAGPLNEGNGQIVRHLARHRNRLFSSFNYILIITLIGYSSTASRSRREAVFRGHHSHNRCGFHSPRCDRAFDAGAHGPFGAEPLARTRVRVRKFSVIALLKQLRRRLRSCHECRAPKKQ